MTTTDMKQEQIKVLIADDHPLFRQGLKHALSESSDILVTGEARNGYELMETIDKTDFDLILLDLSMPGKSGLEVLKQLKAERPNLPVLVVSMHPEDQYAVRVIKAGASGYITKESNVDILIEAVRKVARGGKYASPEITEKLAFGFFSPSNTPHETLSDREYQVFCMIAQGKSLTEIGKELSLSVKTISTHRSRILEKMGLTRNAELIHYAIQNKLL
ncbi:MAG: response regulator transcription factor [Candidatus Nitrohelix vancouverensis]|uniref:Response regulator transcription factor n=1 Tax=Candidatus Nitrohelix vancouverensis TaxID=2705534 RepID=A0A7T0C4J2_9BACT|nr:MAG: response regulator transcription factor [Candidatus Nitrohelix vancouverensis]